MLAIDLRTAQAFVHLPHSCCESESRRHEVCIHRPAETLPEEWWRLNLQYALIDGCHVNHQLGVEVANVDAIVVAIVIVIAVVIAYVIVVATVAAIAVVVAFVVDFELL